MQQSKCVGEDWADLRHLKFKRQVVFFQNCIDLSLASLKDGSFKVLLAFSEPEFFRVSNKQIILNARYFDLILTFDEEILDKCKNAVKFLFGTTWIGEQAASIDVSIKNPQVSFLCGGKSDLKGHLLRHELWKRQKEIIFQKDFVISGAIPIESIDNNRTLLKDEPKFALFETSQFHICIENSRINNYFTEKICDCFNTLTVPIYWGAPNIAKYFDQDGIILFDNVSELIEKVNNLTDKDYKDRMPSILKNKKTVEQYVVGLSTRIKSIVDIYI